MLTSVHRGAYSDRPIFKQEKQNASAAMPPKGHHRDDARLGDGATKPPRYSHSYIVVATFRKIHACAEGNITENSCLLPKSSDKLAAASQQHFMPKSPGTYVTSYTCISSKNHSSGPWEIWSSAKTPTLSTNIVYTAQPTWAEKLPSKQ